MIIFPHFLYFSPWAAVVSLALCGCPLPVGCSGCSWGKDCTWVWGMACAQVPPREKQVCLLPSAIYKSKWKESMSLRAEASSSTPSTLSSLLSHDHSGKHIALSLKNSVYTYPRMLVMLMRWRPTITRPCCGASSPAMGTQLIGVGEELPSSLAPAVSGGLLLLSLVSECKAISKTSKSGV